MILPTRGDEMSNNFLMRVADRVLNRPLLILPDKLAIVTEVLAGRIGVDGIRAEFAPLEPDGAALAETSLMRPVASRFVGDAFETDERGRPTQKLPYRRTADGVAVISIIGSLVNRGAFVGPQSGMQSYEGIGFQLESAARDPKVKSIVLDLDSPGGEAIGAFETAALVRKVSSAKPVYAFVNGMAASAAYAIASGAKAILSTESGLSGSIGVVLMHADYSRAIDRAGITPTLIHAGEHKVDGNPYTPLSKDVRADLQAEVDRLYDQFTKTVAEGRGRRLTAKAARATGARTFSGSDAKAAGLVDDIGTFADLVGSLGRGGAAAGRNKGMKMNLHSDEDLARVRAEAHATGLAEGRKAGHAAGVEEGKAAAFTEGKAAGLEEGKKIGALEERERIKAIIGSEEAKGREASAQHMALNTSMSVEEVNGVLAGLPRTTSIAARQAETVVLASVDTGETSKAGAPAQKGAVAWDDVVSQVNAEFARETGRARR